MNFLNALTDFILFAAAFLPYMIGLAVLYWIAMKTQHLWEDKFAALMGIEEEASIQEKPQPTLRLIENKKQSA